MSVSVGFGSVKRAAAAVAVVSAMAGIVGLPAVSASAATSVAGELAGVKDIAYMPANAGWSQMWTNWQPTQINSDLARIKGLGATTVRAIVQPFTFGFTTPTAVMQARFDQFVSMAQANGLTVQLTLFDQFGNYDQIPQSIAWVDHLLAAYKNSPALAFVEVQNEVDPSNPAVMSWLQALIPALKAAVGSIPVTVSTPGADGIAGLAALKAGLVADPPDFYDYHYYGTTGAALTTLAAAQAAAAPAPLFVGEAGLSTDDPQMNLGSEANQGQFYAAVEAATTDLGMPPAGIWTLNDFNRNAIPVSLPNQEMYFGLYRTDGTAKPAASVIATAFTSPAATTAPVFNSGFENIADSLPTGWSPTNMANGTLAVDATVAHSGTDSVSISNTTGPITAQPSWTSTINTGPVTAGTNYQATVWAKGAAGTGQSVAAVAWFAADGTFISNTSSPALPPGDSNWTELGVDTTAPAGAAYAQLSLQSYNNTGTVWFDDANVANLGTSAFPALPPVPKTSGVGPVVANPGFETVNNNVPTAWSPTNAANGTLAVDATVAHSGTNSVSISNTTGSISAQPAWTTTINTGLVTAGTNYQATVWAKGAAATGQNVATVAWFNNSGGFISNTSSPALPPGDSNWTELGVDTTAPAGAAYAQLSLQSYNNTGTVWFDDANVTNLGTSAFPALPPVPKTSGVGPVVANPGFETVNNNVPTAWSPTNAANGTLAVDATVAHSGTNSVSISNTTGSISAQPAWTTTINTGLVTAGTNYQATVWAKGAAATGQSVATVAWFNNSGGFISNTSSPALPPGDSNWTELGVDTTAPAGAAYAQLSLQSYNNTGTVWFDDANVANLGSSAFPALPPVPKTSGVGPVVANPGFESLTGTTPTAWGTANTANGTLAVDTTTAHSGTNSVRIAATSGSVGAQPSWVSTINTGLITAGTHYTATVWAKGAAATGQSVATIAWFNSTGGFISNTSSAALPTGTTNWTTLTVNASAPAGAAYGHLTLQSYANSGTVWFDDANVTVG